jgi:hypothetical protein
LLQTGRSTAQRKVGNVPATQDTQAILFANQGYVAVNVGFHQTGSTPVSGLTSWYGDLSESVKGALDALCMQSFADCSAVVLVGESFGGTQIHPVVRYLRANNVFDGSSGANGGRRVVGLLGQDSGYTLNWAAPFDADATAYSIALIENLGDTTFPTDTCDWGNCGARNRADYHKTASGSQYVLSYCPAGGEHGTRGYAGWNAWVLSAVKTMLHSQRGVAKFTGYVEPTLAVSNACATIPVVPTQCTLSARPAVMRVGRSSTLTAKCSPVASSYSWIGGTCVGNTTATCTVSPAVTTTYSVTGGNSNGPGTAATTVKIGATDLSSILMLLLN